MGDRFQSLKQNYQALNLEPQHQVRLHKLCKHDNKNLLTTLLHLTTLNLHFLKSNLPWITHHSKILKVLRPMETVKCTSVASAAKNSFHSSFSLNTSLLCMLIGDSYKRKMEIAKKFY